MHRRLLDEGKDSFLIANELANEFCRDGFKYFILSGIPFEAAFEIRLTEMIDGGRQKLYQLSCIE